MDHPDLLLLVRITIFTLLLDIGVTLPFGQLTSLWRRPALLIRSLLAVLATPLTLPIFHAMFVLETSGFPSVEVAREVAIVQFLPVSIGLLVRRLVPGLAGIAAKPLTVLANVLFGLLIAAILVPGIRMILHFGTLPALAVVIMVGISLAIGHLLGAPLPMSVPRSPSRASRATSAWRSSSRP